MSEQQEKRPTLPGWVELQPPALDSNVLAASAWCRGPTRVISTLVMADLPDRSGVGPQWHISVSHKGKRPRDTDVRGALRAFGMMGQKGVRLGEEDNHHPGNARHFWLPVDPAHRVDCECKEDEELITERDGYRWTNPHQGTGACRGCSAASVLGRPCPLHGPRVT